jgi:hypothetical protein
MTVESPPPAVARFPAPRIDSVVLPAGTMSVTWLVHVQVPAGTFTVVVEETTELNAVWTAVEEQLAALIVWPCAEKALNRSMNDSHFIAMVGGHRSFTSYCRTTSKYCPHAMIKAISEGTATGRAEAHTEHGRPNMPKRAEKVLYAQESNARGVMRLRIPLDKVQLAGGSHGSPL